MTTASFCSMFGSAGVVYLVTQIFCQTDPSAFSTKGAGVNYSTFCGTIGGLPIGGGVFAGFLIGAFIGTGGFFTIPGTMITDSTTYSDGEF